MHRLATPSLERRAPSGDESVQLSIVERVMVVATAVLVLVSLWKFAVRPITDPDAWLHLRIGSYLASGGRFSGPDPWSAYAATRYTPTQWLPEILGARLTSAVGFFGVAVLILVGALLLFLGLLYACRVRADAVPAALAALAGLLGAAGGVAPRPQLLALVFLAVTVGAWWRSAYDLRPRWWLIPLTWVWACCHGLWIVGVGVGVLAIGLSLADRWSERRRILRLLVVPGLSLLSAALTPLGLAGLLAPLQVTDAVSPFVQEWQPPTIHNPVLVVMLVTAALVLVLWLRAGRQVSWLNVGFLLASVVAALLMGRLIAVGAVMLAPVLATTLQDLRHHPRARVGRWEVMTWAAASVLILAVGFVRVPTAVAQPGLPPEGLRNAVAALPVGSRLYDAQELSGWVMWVNPRVKLVIDLRTEIYSANHVKGYVSALAAEPGWQQYVTSTRSDFALLKDDTPLGDAFGRLPGWTRMASDSGYTLWRHRSSAS